MENQKSVMINVYLDDLRDPPEFTIPIWVPIRNDRDLRYLLRHGMVRDLTMDHDLGEDSLNGYEICCWMEANNIWPNGVISIHTANPVGRANMLACLKKNGKV